MPLESALALVLRVVEFSETSSVVWLFTRELGKVRALAKGARRRKSPFESALDLLSLCRIVLLRKTSEALDVLTEAKLERRFRTPGRSLSHLYAAYYVAELLNELTHDHDPHPELFDAAFYTLDALSRAETPVATHTIRFELTAVRLLGHMPSLASCVECGRPAVGSGRAAFGVLQGGLLCEQCRPGKRHVVSISRAALAAMEQLAEPRDLRDEGTDPADMELDHRVSGELRGILNQYMNHLLGRRPRLQAYLTSVSNSLHV